MSATPASPPPSVGKDEADRAGQAGARAAWIAPGVRQLKAGEAELNPVVTNDSEGTVS
jgi:hypothetical protein